FPEIEAAARGLGHSVILDGEIVAFSDRILPFAIIQKRLGRRKVGEALLRDAPVVFFAFDLLYLDEVALFETALRERVEKLNGVLCAGGGAGAPLRTCHRTTVRSAGDIDIAFDDARARANEGLV